MSHLNEKLYETVYSILVKHPESRACDIVLAELVLDRQMKISPNILLRTLNCSKITATDLFNYIKDGYLSGYDAISRTRRKIQEQNPQLKNEDTKEKRSELELETRGKISEYGKKTERKNRSRTIAGKHPSIPEYKRFGKGASIGYANNGNGNPND